ncbi:MAG: hypothetical protein ACXVRQ_01595 [Gaiellaceae bacterium]
MPVAVGQTEMPVGLCAVPTCVGFTDNAEKRPDSQQRRDLGLSVDPRAVKRGHVTA